MIDRYFFDSGSEFPVYTIGMGTVAVHHPTYGNRIRYTDTVPYEPLEELSTVRVAVRLIPYNNPYGSGRNGRMYGIYQKCLISIIILLSLALVLV